MSFSPPVLSSSSFPFRGDLGSRAYKNPPFREPLSTLLSFDSTLVSLRRRNMEPESPPEDDEVCRICLDDIHVREDGSTNDCVYVHVACHKFFHIQCLDTWLREPRARGKCPHCKDPVRRAARRNVRRRLDFSAPPPNQWICRPFANRWAELVPALACWRRLEDLDIPYMRLPIIPDLRRHFPNNHFDYERSEEVPVIVDMDSIRELQVPLMVLNDPEYLRAAREESTRYNLYLDMFYRIHRGRLLQQQQQQQQPTSIQPLLQLEPRSPAPASPPTSSIQPPPLSSAPASPPTSSIQPPPLSSPTSSIQPPPLSPNYSRSPRSRTPIYRPSTSPPQLSPVDLRVSR